MDASGGAAAFKQNRIEQIFRDMRMGRFHPGNTLWSHEVIGKLCLGIDPDAPQGWG
jgi:alkylation response protein AidB-like acyl-CoA dehydrogenase